MRSGAPARAFRAGGFDYRRARILAAELDLSEPVAVTLVRRGHASVADARSFLEAAEAHSPLEFEGMEAATHLVLSHIRDGRLITIHGDYDVDGVSATAVMVSCLRALGAEVDWLIPDRLGEGYGLSLAGIEEVSRRGTGLLITVDCGVGSAEEVRAARDAGIDVIVTDHHQPPESLPDCTILHPVLSGYPFTELCGTGVAHKLATALRFAAGDGDPEHDLDLVALATVADMVPLLGENRRLVRDGLAAMRTGPRPGLRALMEVSRTEVASLDAAALSFRLAPRINAAGRPLSGRRRSGADAHRRSRASDGDRRRARPGEQRAADDRARGARVRRAGAGGASTRARRGSGTRPRGVGMASRRGRNRRLPPGRAPLAPRRPGRARGRARAGLGRSVPGFDLVGALEACSEHLTRFGGHKMAAGLELQASELERFREAFLEHTATTLDPEAAVRTAEIDAIVGVGPEGIGLGLAEELERLGPFGQGNPEPRLLVPAARLRDVHPLGEEGRHSRFQLLSGVGRAAGVAFGVNGGLDDSADEPLDLAVSLELDRWNGSVQPRVILRERYPAAAEGEEPADGSRGCGAGGCPDLTEGWWERFEAELERSPGSLPNGVAAAIATRGQPREPVDRRGGAAVAAIVELVSSGGAVLAICADASRRRRLATEAADPARFGGPRRRSPALAALRPASMRSSGTPRRPGDRGKSGSCSPTGERSRSGRRPRAPSSTSS